MHCFKTSTTKTVENRRSYDGSEKGSLWAYLNRCGSAFGRRLLKEWLCKPLMGTAFINARLDAVSELIGELSPEADELRRNLKGLPVSSTTL
jgi:DNA mismatch repair ATPase MutS